MAGVLREHGATLAQCAVLTAPDEEPGLSNADLARRAFVTPQTMNQILQELEQKGWVARHPALSQAHVTATDVPGTWATGEKMRCSPRAGWGERDRMPVTASSWSPSPTASSWIARPG